MQALYIGQTLRKSFKEDDSFCGKIHSLFDSACNILISSKIITLTTDEVGNGPYNILISKEDKFYLWPRLRENLPCAISRNKLSFTNRQSINLDKAIEWNPEANFICNDPIKLQININDLKKNIIHKDNPSCFKVLLTRNYVSLIELKILEFVDNLLGGIKQGNNEKIEESVSKLVGLGPGLTPAGDDFLAGFMLGLLSFQNIFLNYDLAEKINKLILKNSCSRTNILSLSFLNSASKGLASEKIKDFLEALFCASGDDFLIKAENLLSYGATSGVDLAIGIISAYDILARSDTEV